MTLAEATGGVTIGTSKENNDYVETTRWNSLRACYGTPKLHRCRHGHVLMARARCHRSECNLPGSYSRFTPQQEIIFLPKSLFPNAAFGLSYIYYAGTKTPMNFEVQFTDFAAGVLEPLANRNVFTGAYTLANLNKWDDENVAD